jgi:serine/threonine protein kinase
MKKQEQFFVTSSKNAGARGSDCRFNCFRNNQSALGAMLFERGGGARNQPSSSKAPPTTTINNNNDISASNGTTTNANSQRVDDKSVEKIVGGVNNKYHLVRTIGRGAHGQVYKGIEATTKKVVAIKEISLAGVLENDLTLVTGEVDLLSSLRHENVVRYIEAIREDQHLYIVLEYCENGSLASALKSVSSNLGGGFGPFPESLAAVYVYHVLQGLRYLHEQGVIHRDVKGANILCTRDGVVKLADFGVATKVNTATAASKVVNVHENSNANNNNNNNSSTSHSIVDARSPSLEQQNLKREEEETAKLIKSRRSQMALRNRLSKENSENDAGNLFGREKPVPPKKEKVGRGQSLGSPDNSPKGGVAKENTNDNIGLETPPTKSLLKSPGSHGTSPSSPRPFSDNVGGSPYWMAPEVIEMNGGVTTAADIWSVGCTLIELLTTKPPYFDLAPMAALFRMVRDDIPPLPASAISKQCEDFLRQCFRRDASTRPTARELLKHPWIENVRNELASTWLPKEIRDTHNALMESDVEQENNTNAMRIGDGLACAVDKMVADVEYRDSVYFSSERPVSTSKMNVDEEKSGADLRRLKLERRELKKKLRKEGDEQPDLKKLSTIDRATAALMAADAVLDNEKKRNIQDSSDSDSNLSSDEESDFDDNKNGATATDSSGANGSRPGYKRNNMRIDVKNLPSSITASDRGALLKEWLDIRSGRKLAGTALNINKGHRSLAFRNSGESDNDSSGPSTPKSNVGTPLSHNGGDHLRDEKGSDQQNRSSFEGSDDFPLSGARLTGNALLRANRGFSRSSSYDDLYGSYGTSQFDEAHINDSWEALAAAMDLKDNGAVERAGISVKDSMERYHLMLDGSGHPIMEESAHGHHQQNGTTASKTTTKTHAVTSLDAEESYGTCKAIPSRRVLSSVADILSNESPEYDRSRCVALEALVFTMRAADQTSRLALANALVALDVCRFASVVAAKDFEVSSRRAKIAALTLLESVAKCQVPAFSAIAPSIAPGIAKALSVGYFGESGKALTRTAVDCARAVFIPPKPRERIQAVRMRQAMVSLKKKLQDRSRFDEKELRNIEREIRQSDMEIIRADAAQLDATWANVRALAKVNVFPHLVQALGQTHFGHLEEAQVANEDPATFTSSSTVTNEKIADFIASLLSNQAMTTKMLSESIGSALEADRERKNDENDDGDEKKKNKAKSKNSGGEEDADDNDGNGGGGGDDDEYLALLEQNAKRTGFKSFDTQTKNLLCDIGVIHGFLAQICVVSKKTREKLATTIESLTENADTLDRLQKSGCIPKLAQLIEITWREDNDDDNQIGYLGFDAERGSKRAGVINVDLLYESVACNGRTRAAALRAIRNLCVASKSYQQQAATCHASWVLCEIATSGTESEKDVCLPLLCSCISASRAAREKLVKHGILNTLVSVIDQDGNCERKILALQACVVWLNAEPWEIEARLLTADALDVLVHALEFSMKNKSNINGESTLHALAKLIGESSRLSRAVSEQENVIGSVLNVILNEPSVREPAATAGCKLAGLKALGHLIEHADKPRDIVQRYQLKKKLEQLARSKTEVIVAQLTDKLMRRLNV